MFVRRGCWLLLILTVSSRLLLFLQMLCGRVGVFPHAMLDCLSLCKPIAARCQFTPCSNELFVFSQERGWYHCTAHGVPRAGLGALALPSALGSCAPQKGVWSLVLPLSSVLRAGMLRGFVSCRAEGRVPASLLPHSYCPWLSCCSSSGLWLRAGSSCSSVSLHRRAGRTIYLPGGSWDSVAGSLLGS